ncbi:hypothetical protein P0082_02150 [Candidatus Haliotispira prima]|uniref:Uncharacterized protein n=1 Tax=Candidatus Haliotispira prima TaxID=3034016 RepID=A0ABY8MKG1_9SPIO|nr:hypothetical protein P0082_02150 [Candidatus Haliotispira prima]
MVIWIGFIGLGLLLFLTLSFRAIWKIEIADSPTMIVISVTLSSIITTALGAVIGSSVD